MQKADIVVELPDYNQNDGGVQRMLRIVMELPHTSTNCGGIRDNIFIAEQFNPKMHVRFQNLRYGYPFLKVNWSVGIPDNTFPECDICITYADNPYAHELLKLPQVKKVYILMLSYGMSINVERRNIHLKGINVLCSSRKIERAILAEQVKVQRVGIGLDMQDMKVLRLKRQKYMAILYHNMPSKAYAQAVKVANNLAQRRVIDGVITFGRKEQYSTAPKPLKLVAHYENASSKQIAHIFNLCSCFLMPSTTEGINLTPIESTLCGCPAVLCDGAIGEIFFNQENCFIVPKNHTELMEKACTEIVQNHEKYSEKFRLHMQETVKDMTWDNVITRLTNILCEQSV